MAISDSVMRELVRRVGSGFRYQLKGWDVAEDRVQAALSCGRTAEVRDILAPHPETPKESFDIILLLEVLEHLSDPDRALIVIKSLLRPDGVVVLSTPNLAAWYNRIFLLLGLQPHCTEVSTRYVLLGNPFLRRVFPSDSGELLAGHLRVFTYRALKEFLEVYGFRILQVRGVSNHRGNWLCTGFARVVSRLWVGGAGDIVVLARK